VFGRGAQPEVYSVDVGADAILVDVREPDEWVAGHVAGAVHIPMMDIPVRMGEIPTEGDVVVVCRSGHRSANVVAYLHHHGWDNVHNLAGGLQDWTATGRTLVAEDGRAGQVI